MKNDSHFARYLFWLLTSINILISLPVFAVEFALGGSEQFSDADNNTIKVQTELKFKMWTLYGEPVWNCHFKWKLQSYNYSLPSGKRITSVPKDVLQEITLSNVRAFIAIGESDKFAKQTTFTCDVGATKKSGKGYSFNTPASDDWKDIFIKNNLDPSVFLWKERKLTKDNFHSAQSAKKIFKALSKSKENTFKVRFTGSPYIRPLEYYAFNKTKKIQQAEFEKKKSTLLKQKTTSLKSSISSAKQIQKEASTSPFDDLISDATRIVAKAIVSSDPQLKKLENKIFKTNETLQKAKLKHSETYSNSSRDDLDVNSDELKRRLKESLAKTTNSCKVDMCFHLHPLNNYGENFSHSIERKGLNRYQKCIQLNTDCDTSEWEVYRDDFNTRYGYKDKNGKIMIKAEFYGAQPFKDHKAIVEKIKSSRSKVNKCGGYSTYTTFTKQFINFKGEIISEINSWVDWNPNGCL